MSNGYFKDKITTFCSYSYQGATDTLREKLPRLLIRIVDGDASDVDVTAVLEREDARLLLEGSLLDGETARRFPGRFGVGDQARVFGVS